ncbi:MAG: polyribonucleotide nucleotidyltransferase [Candidatus Spechtbacterales bacterium]
MEEKEFTLDVGGRPLKFRFTNWAQQATGSVIAEYGDTVVLTTAVMDAKDQKIDYFPLTLEYREKYYAAGFIGGGRYMKREARPSDEATLKARLIDRSLRPLFNQKMRRGVQVVNTVLSFDPQNEPDILSLNSSSAALAVSSIPWDGPVGAVMLGKIDGKWVVNPGLETELTREAEITVAGTAEKINMIETGANELSEKEILEGIELGFEEVKKIVHFIDAIRKEMGQDKKQIEIPEASEDLKNEIRKEAEEKIKNAIYSNNTEGGAALEKTAEDIESYLKEKYGNDAEEVKTGMDYVEKLTDDMVHQAALKDERRVDGRKMDEVRPLSARVSILPRTHGSGLFMRGLTHALSITTLDTPGEEELSEDMEGESKKRFMHHYNFPPYSTGETGFFRGPGRREIGHGALAEKALRPLIPATEEFPYVIRVVTEILSSNGSTSMASTCGSSLSLMDAGVPMKRHVAGIAMGLMGSDENAKILTDIQGPEDHYGDMDFKVAGTREGLTAVQLDVKIEGIEPKMIEKVLDQAKKAREHILSEMEKAIPKHSDKLSRWAPTIKLVRINPEKIGMLIGPGGKMIKEIMAETNTEINVEDSGEVFISGKDTNGVERAFEWVYNLTREIKIGEVFDAKVIKVADFGAFVELVPGQEALVHVSELSDKFVKNVEDVVKEGDTIKVKVIKKDEQGKIGASAKKAALSQ